MEKKYEFTGETIHENGTTLNRIRALRDFNGVKAGDLGGWIEKEENLSHYGNCWVGENAKVFDDAKVYGNALIANDAIVYNNADVSCNAFVYDYAKVYGKCILDGNVLVYGNANVHDNARITDYARVHGNAVVSDTALVYDYANIADRVIVSGKAKVYGDAIVHGNAKITDNAKVHGNVVISGNAKITRDIFNSENYIAIGPIGSRDDYTTFLKTSETIYVKCGCFDGTIDEFTEKVLETHGDNKHAKDYTDAVQFVLKKFDRVEKDIIKIPLLNNIGKPNINGVVISEEAFENYINSDYYKELIDNGRLYLTYGGIAGEFLDRYKFYLRRDIMDDYIIGKVESIDKNSVSVKVISNKDALLRSLAMGYKAYLIYQAIQRDDNIIKEMKIMYCGIGPDIMKGVTKDD